MRPARDRGARLFIDRDAAALAGRLQSMVVANFVWLWPIFTGAAITTAHRQAELWLPSWR